MPSKIARQAPSRFWSDRRIQVFAGALLAGLVVFGMVLPIGAMQFENHDSFCASCHTEGETTFFQRSTASPAIDLASFHAMKAATRCIDCHSAPGIVGRYVTLTYGASDLVSYFSGHYPQPAVQDTPIGDGNCLKCHSDVMTKKDFSNHFHLFLAQWKSLAPADAGGCVDCHVSHDTKNDAGAAFLDRNTTVQICDKCHSMAGEG